MEGHIGLTDFGKQVIAEMNRVGMVVDASHMGCRATMETFETSTAPVIFSHSNPKGVKENAATSQMNRSEPVQRPAALSASMTSAIFSGNIK